MFKWDLITDNINESGPHADCPAFISLPSIRWMSQYRNMKRRSYKMDMIVTRYARAHRYFLVWGALVTTRIGRAMGPKRTARLQYSFSGVRITYTMFGLSGKVRYREKAANESFFGHPYCWRQTIRLDPCRKSNLLTARGHGSFRFFKYCAFIVTLGKERRTRSRYHNDLVGNSVVIRSQNQHFQSCVTYALLIENRSLFPPSPAMSSYRD